jgi:hypothetical protein
VRTRAIVLGVVLVAAILAGVELGSDPPSPTRRLVVRVDEVVEADVDYKIGFACDDVAILRAWMVTRAEHNWFIVEGVAAGRTWCRVGTDPNLPSYLFEVIVEPKRPSTT